MVLSEQRLVGRHCTWGRNTIFFVTFCTRIFPKDSFWSPSRNPQTPAVAEREKSSGTSPKVITVMMFYDFYSFNAVLLGGLAKESKSLEKKLHKHAHSESDWGTHAPATRRWPLRLAQAPLAVSNWSTEVTKATFFFLFLHNKKSTHGTPAGGGRVHTDKHTDTHTTGPHGKPGPRWARKYHDPFRDLSWC